MLPLFRQSTEKAVAAPLLPLVCNYASWSVPLAVYLHTLAPVAMWGDSAKYVLHARVFDLPVDAGYHPLYSLLSHLWLQLNPWSQGAVWLNLFSALISASVAAVLFRFLVWEGVRAWIALCMTWAFAFSHVNWHLSVIAESYALSALGVIAVLWGTRALLRRIDAAGDAAQHPPAADGDSAAWTIGTLRATANALREKGLSLWPFFGLGLGAGLVVSNYLLMVAYFLVVLTVIAWRLRVGHARLGASTQSLPSLSRVIPVMALGLILGSCLMWIPVVMAATGGGMSWGEAWGLALNGRYASEFFWQAPSRALRGVAMLGGFTLYEYPSVVILLAAVGVVALWRDRTRRAWSLALVAVAGGTYLFCCTYMIQRAIFVLLPSFLVLAYCAGVGGEVLLARSRRYRRTLHGLIAVSALAPLVVYPAVVLLLSTYPWVSVPGRDIAFRDNARFFLLPSKRSDRGPERFSQEAFSTVPPGGVLLSDFTPHTVLKYYQEEVGFGRGVDVRFVEGIDASELRSLLENHVDAGKGLFLADNEAGAYPTTLPIPYALEKVGSIYQIVRRH